MDKKVVVIGASNLDVKGRSLSKTISRTKNPGKVELSAGGVGRNVAENIARLGISSVLLSAVGSEGFSDIILEPTKQAGVDVSRVLKTQASSGIFLAIVNSRGELDASISDMSVLSKITPEYILDNIDVFDGASYLILDADIPEATLSLCLSVAKERKIPICIEPVSPSKAQILTGYLSGIEMTTPNREELEAMVNRTLSSEDDIKQAGNELLEIGVKYVIITLGAEGIYCVSKDYSGFIPSIRTMVVNSVGAGDALVSGVVSGLLRNMSFEDSIKLGIASATITIMEEGAVSSNLTISRAIELMSKILS